MSTAAVSTKLWASTDDTTRVAGPFFFQLCSQFRPQTEHLWDGSSGPQCPWRGGVLCWSGKLMMLHIHKVGENLAFYKDLLAAYDRGVWIYIPMSSGERILEIWGRRGRLDDRMGLLVRFNCLLATRSLADNWKDEDKQSKTGSYRSAHIKPSADAKWRHSPSLDAAMCSSRRT